LNHQLAFILLVGSMAFIFKQSQQNVLKNEVTVYDGVILLLGGCVLLRCMK